MKKTYIGAAYYPELWDESEVEKDIERCKNLNINTLRIGEFAWSKMEPQEGQYDFAWLERILDRLYANGLYTVLCTPTCTPPRWLLNRYPEVIRVLSDGKKMQIVSRCHPCKSSEQMREKNRQIVTEMAMRFGKHPGVIGWQIDNELYPYQFGCYCENCRMGFQKSLKQKYETIENLNQSWGMYRWSLNYNSFDEIDPPPQGGANWVHPSLCTAWWQYQCNLISSYVDEQAAILHTYSNAPVGTDMMPTNRLPYCRITKNLDVVQFNHYEPADALLEVDFNYDYLRTLKNRPFWVTETQVGWNGSEFSEFGYRPIGNCYVNTWLPIALGGEMNLYWLYRAHPNGHELAHGALFSTAGRPYRVSEEVRQASLDFEKCASVLENTKIRSDIAIHYSASAEIQFAFAPILKNFNYRTELLERFHRAFKHYNVDLIDPEHDLNGYRVLLSPFLFHIDERTKEKVKEWVAAGGTWIVGPMSDIMTECGSKYTNAPFSFLEEYAGVYVKYQKPIANSIFKARWENGDPVNIYDYYDALVPVNSKKLIAYDGDEFGGYAVVTEKKVGLGRIILLGSVPSHETLRFLTGVEPIAEASDHIRLVERSGSEKIIIALEQQHKEGYLMLNDSYYDLLHDRIITGKVTISPYEVLVLKQIKL